MKKTNQLNIRMSEELFKDIDFIGRYKKLKGTDWLKVKIADVISHEKNKICDRIDAAYVFEHIDDKEYEKMIGHPPSNTLVAEMISRKDGAKNFIKNTLKNLDKKK